MPQRPSFAVSRPSVPMMVIRQRSPSPAQVMRSPSPQRIIINNKLVKSTVPTQQNVPVAHQRAESALATYRNNSSLNISTHRTSADLEIREQGTLQRLKDTYEK